MGSLSFQEINKKLNNYWEEQGCALIPSYPMSMGAGTLSPFTALRAVDDKEYKLAYIQPTIRPNDARYGKHPGRLYQHHQYQVILKPAPKNIRELFLKSLDLIGIETKEYDIRLSCDNWENPSIGAAGVGWEIWCDGTEIAQFTYMQQMGGIDCKIITGEITYGMERIACIAQNVSSVYDIQWNENLTYKDLFFKHEVDFSTMTYEEKDNEHITTCLKHALESSKSLLCANAVVAAYHRCLEASHLLNVLDSRRVISTTMRASLLLQVREMVKNCCMQWMEFQESTPRS